MLPNVHKAPNMRTENGWMSNCNKSGNIHTVEYYAAIRRNEFALLSMDLGGRPRPVGRGDEGRAQSINRAGSLQKPTERPPCVCRGRHLRRKRAEARVKDSWRAVGCGHWAEGMAGGLGKKRGSGELCFLLLLCMVSLTVVSTCCHLICEKILIKGGGGEAAKPETEGEREEKC